MKYSYIVDRKIEGEHFSYGTQSEDKYLTQMADAGWRLVSVRVPLSNFAPICYYWEKQIVDVLDSHFEKYIIDKDFKNSGVVYLKQNLDDFFCIVIDPDTGKEWKTMKSRLTKISTPAPVSGEQCNHEAITDTGIGYYHCPMCHKGWTYSEWEKIKPAPVSEPKQD